MEGDPVRLAQILSNLLSNAAKYAPPDGRIDLVVAADEAEVVVRVTDDGIGLAREDLERVFGLFEQGAVRPDGDEGLGVGLALSRRLAHLHGGSLTASSPGPGKGSTFTLRLPRATAPHRAAPVPGGLRLTRRRRAACSSSRTTSTERGRSPRSSPSPVTTFTSRRTARRASKPRGELLPDAVVLDLGLPGIDGYELARRLRSEPALAGTLLVALSGWAGREERARAVDAGIDHHLVKPVSASRIAELLATATTRPRT